MFIRPPLKSFSSAYTSAFSAGLPICTSRSRTFSRSLLSSSSCRSATLAAFSASISTGDRLRHLPRLDADQRLTHLETHRPILDLQQLRHGRSRAARRRPHLAQRRQYAVALLLLGRLQDPTSAGTPSAPSLPSAQRRDPALADRLLLAVEQFHQQRRMRLLVHRPVERLAGRLRTSASSCCNALISGGTAPAAANPFAACRHTLASRSANAFVHACTVCSSFGAILLSEASASPRSSAEESFAARPATSPRAGEARSPMSPIARSP